MKSIQADSVVELLVCAHYSFVKKNKNLTGFTYSKNLPSCSMGYGTLLIKGRHSLSCTLRNGRTQRCWHSVRWSKPISFLGKWLQTRAANCASRSSSHLSTCPSACPRYACLYFIFRFLTYKYIYIYFCNFSFGREATPELLAAKSQVASSSAVDTISC